MGDRLPPSESRLPPAPLAEARRGPEWAQTALPWTTALAIGGVGLAVGLLDWLVRYLQARPGSPPPGPDSLGCVASRSVWAAMCWGLGLVAVDRWLPQWPRPARWAVGLGLGSLVPDPGFVLQAARLLTRSLLPMPGDITDQLFPWVVFAVLYGCFLGLAARRPDGVLWRLPLVGVAVQAGPLLVILLVAVIFVPSALPTGRGAVGQVVWPMLEGVLYGGLLGFVIGERLRAAWRRELASWQAVSRPQAVVAEPVHH
jgi:hypothetical protein